MTTEKRRKVLFLEERLAVVRAMVNGGDLMDVDTDEKRRFLALQLLTIIDGERAAVPRKHRHLIRRGNQ